MQSNTTTTHITVTKSTRRTFINESQVNTKSITLAPPNKSREFQEFYTVDNIVGRVIREGVQPVFDAKMELLKDQSSRTSREEHRLKKLAWKQALYRGDADISEEDLAKLETHQKMLEDDLGLSRNLVEKQLFNTFRHNSQYSFLKKGSQTQVGYSHSGANMQLQQEEEEKEYQRRNIVPGIDGFQEIANQPYQSSSGNTNNKSESGSMNTTDRNFMNGKKMYHPPSFNTQSAADGTASFGEHTRRTNYDQYSDANNTALNSQRNPGSVENPTNRHCPPQALKSMDTGSYETMKIDDCTKHNNNFLQQIKNQGNHTHKTRTQTSSMEMKMASMSGIKDALNKVKVGSTQNGNMFSAQLNKNRYSTKTGHISGRSGNDSAKTTQPSYVHVQQNQREEYESQSGRGEEEESQREYEGEGEEEEEDSFSSQQENIQEGISEMRRLNSDRREGYPLDSVAEVDSHSSIKNESSVQRHRQAQEEGVQGLDRTLSQLNLLTQEDDETEINVQVMGTPFITKRLNMRQNSIDLEKNPQVQNKVHSIFGGDLTKKSSNNSSQNTFIRQNLSQNNDHQGNTISSENQTAEFNFHNTNSSSKLVSQNISSLEIENKHIKTEPSHLSGSQENQAQNSEQFFNCQSKEKNGVFGKNQNQENEKKFSLFGNFFDKKSQGKNQEEQNSNNFESEYDTLKKDSNNKNTEQKFLGGPITKESMGIFENQKTLKNEDEEEEKMEEDQSSDNESNSTSQLFDSDVDEDSKSSKEMYDKMEEHKENLGKNFGKMTNFLKDRPVNRNSLHTQKSEEISKRDITDVQERGDNSQIDCSVYNTCDNGRSEDNSQMMNMDLEERNITNSRRNRKRNLDDSSDEFQSVQSNNSYNDDDAPPQMISSKPNTILGFGGQSHQFQSKVIKQNTFARTMQPQKIYKVVSREKELNQASDVASQMFKSQNITNQNRNSSSNSIQMRTINGTNIGQTLFPIESQNENMELNQSHPKDNIVNDSTPLKHSQSSYNQVGGLSSDNTPSMTMTKSVNIIKDAQIKNSKKDLLTNVAGYLKDLSILNLINKDEYTDGNTQYKVTRHQVNTCLKDDTQMSQIEKSYVKEGGVSRMTETKRSTIDSKSRYGNDNNTFNIE